MADLHKAEAAAREAVAEVERIKAEYKEEPFIKAFVLIDLLAALDAARGEAVAWQSVRGGRLYLSRHDAVLNGEQMVTPLYAAPPAAAVPKGMVMVQRADIEALEATDFGRCGWGARSDLAARRLRAAMLAAMRETP